MITILPFELLAQITEELSQQELLRCMCVCRSWYSTFTPILYGRVILSKDPKQFRRFVDALEKSPDLRNLVHSLRWCAEIITYANVDNLSQQCQNIGCMSITWSSRAILSPLAVSLETFSVLTRLTLEYHGNGLGPKTAEYGSTKLAAFLTSVPRLQALSLIHVIPLVRCIELNSIHKACTELRYLDVTCVHWDAKCTDIPGIGPFPGLRTLKITYERAGSQCTRFLSEYLQEHLVPRYPNLRHVEFRRTNSSDVLATSTYSSYAGSQQQRHQQQQQAVEPPWLLWNDTIKRANFRGLRKALAFLANGADNARLTRILCSTLPRRSTYHLLITTTCLSFTGFLHSDHNCIEIDTLMDRFAMVNTLFLETSHIKVSRHNKKSRAPLLRLRTITCKNVQMDFSAIEYIHRHCRHVDQVNFSICQSHNCNAIGPPSSPSQTSTYHATTSSSSNHHICEPIEAHSVQDLRTLCENRSTIINLLAACWSISSASTIINN
ncbi:hypothetical protein BDB00DRAFT_817214 [Zychaea mexicana]|uniref:uncharacterized protein n=1 Tax=Zychaea mexicana TaxID=64656 RepID=UPI0022FDC1B0|nr:uncharacterized protein BDB00DRAFT_817214 [Zychaea mexicana]KAI9494821.1 hypothetical protein BDB00DRAFT_817214 [Zychaea mexicana]